MDERIKLSVFFFFPSKNGYKESVDEVYESDITWNDSIKGSLIYVYTSSEIWSNLSFHVIWRSMLLDGNLPSVPLGLF